MDSELRRLERSEDPQDQVKYLTQLLRAGQLQPVDILILTQCNYLPGQMFVDQNSIFSEKYDFQKFQTKKCNREALFNDDEYYLFYDSRIMREGGPRRLPTVWDTVISRVFTDLPGLEAFIDFFCYFSSVDVGFLPQYLSVESLEESNKVKAHGGRLALLAFAAYLFHALENNKAPRVWLDFFREKIISLQNNDLASLGDLIREQSRIPAWTAREPGAISATLQFPAQVVLLIQVLQYARQELATINQNFFPTIVNGYLGMVIPLENPNLIDFVEVVEYMKNYIVNALLKSDKIF